MESVSYAEPIDMNEKVCVDCNTSKTPLWRSGPAGPKSLCNACGIRFKKKRSMVGSDKKKEKLLLSPISTSSSSSTTAGHTTSVGNREMKRGDLRRKLRVNVVAMGKEVVLLRRQRSPVKRQRVERFGEVEEAAFVLMSLSCGLVFG